MRRFHCCLSYHKAFGPVKNAPEALYIRLYQSIQKSVSETRKRSYPHNRQAVTQTACYTLHR